MITKLIDLSFEQARYELLKELDTRGDIGKFIMDRHPGALKIFVNIINYTDKVIHNDIKEEELAGISDEYALFLNDLALKIPAYSFMNPSHNWNLFCSAFFCIVEQYINIEQKLSTLLEPESKEYKEEEHKISQIRDGILTIISFLDFGASYSDLVAASAKLIAEMKIYENSRPVALKLSEAYLQSLNCN